MYTQQRAVELGFDNLVNLSVDSITVSREVYAALKDGVQLTDAFTLFNQFPAISRIGGEAKQAFRELRDLKPAEAEAAALEISNRTGLPNDGTVLGKVRTALALVAKTYKVVDEAVAVGHEWKNLFEAQPAMAA